MITYYNLNFLLASITLLRMCSNIGIYSRLDYKVTSCSVETDPCNRSVYLYTMLTSLLLPVEFGLNCGPSTPLSSLPSRTVLAFFFFCFSCRATLVLYMCVPNPSPYLFKQDETMKRELARRDSMITRLVKQSKQFSHTASPSYSKKSR